MAASPPSQRAKTDPVTIGTHNGNFHCDEALACHMLKKLPEFSSATIVRSRTPEVLAACSIVVDVGGTYDHEAKRYDHHQLGFDHHYPCPSGGVFPWKMSSAGLVFLHYGARVISEMSGISVDDAQMPVVLDRVYEKLMAEIDAIDNGFAAYDAGVKPKYDVGGSIGHRVALVNTRKQHEDVNFAAAMQTVGEYFDDFVLDCISNWLPSRAIVAQALSTITADSPSGKVLLLQQSCSWKGHLDDLERERGCHGQCLYAVFPDAGGSWRVQAVPVEPTSFECRKALPQQWRALRDEQLSQASGVPGGVFVHANGFIGGHSTREGALRMAELAVTM